MNQSLKKPTILIVDDDVSSRMLVDALLRREGYRTIQAENGREGFSAFMNDTPDIVLMDVMMPIMNGYDATRAIREYEGNSFVPILMLTATGDTDAIQNAFDAGATDFITKNASDGEDPQFAFFLLVQRVKYALRTAQIENELRKRQKELQFAQQLSKIGYWEWDCSHYVEDGKEMRMDEVHGSEVTFSMFEIPNGIVPNLEQFTSKIFPSDRPEVENAITKLQQKDLLEDNTIEMCFRVRQHGKQVKYINCLAKAEYDSNSNLVKLIGSAQDISRLSMAEQALEHESTHDPLTKLANRAQFLNLATQHLKSLSDNNSNISCSIIVFDIDRFRNINTSMGQVVGDQLLIDVAERIRKIIRKEDIIARIGNDEFAILLNYETDDQGKEELILQRIKRDLNTPFVIDGNEVFNGYSIGIAHFPEHSTSAETLLSRANTARKKAKTSGGNQFVFYNNNLDEDKNNIVSMESELRHAIYNGEIQVYFQPQVYTDTLKPYGAEALVRWIHPTRGIISPAQFIPIAESTGLIIPIGRLVMEQAILQAKEWHDMGYKIHIGINVSGRQFKQGSLMKDVQSVLAKTDLPAQYVDLEITESLAMDDAGESIKILKQLKALGISLSIDDFGTGYSSLSYLHSFPIDTIKIDRSFVINTDNKEGQAIAGTIALLAESLHLNVIAEGIELQSQLDFLRTKFCPVLQGFMFGKPLPKEEFIEWLTKFEPIR